MTDKQMELVDSCFTWATDGTHPLLLLEWDNNDTHQWLTVRYRDIDGSTGKKWKWGHLCSMAVTEESTVFMVINKITLMLADQLRSKAQDVNILMEGIKNS